MKRHPKGGREMVKQQRWTREQLKEWLVEIRDHWRGRDSEYGPTPMQIRTYKTGRRWEPQPLYKDFVNEFGSYEEALAAVGMKVPPEARKKVGPELKTQAEQGQESQIQIEEAKTRLETKKKKTKQKQGRRRPKGAYDALELAKNLREACDYVGKPKITIVEYTAWRELVLENDAERKVPVAQVLIARLGGDSWNRAFEAMQELLVEPGAATIEPTDKEKPKARQENDKKTASARRRPEMAKAEAKVEKVVEEVVVEPRTEAEAVETDLGSREVEPASVAARETALDMRVDGEIQRVSVVVSRMKLQLRLTWQ